MIKKIIAIICMSPLYIGAMSLALEVEESVPEAKQPTKVLLEKNADEIDAFGLTEGSVYIRSMRGSPKTELLGKSVGVKAGELVSAEGFSVECAAGENAVFVLSNRSAVYMRGPAKIKITEFKQAQPFRSFLSDEREASRSIVKFKIDFGEFYFSGLEPRETSSTEIESSVGVLKLRAPSYRIISANDKLEISIMKGQGTLHPLDFGKSVFINNGQTAFLEKTLGGGVSSVVEQIPVTAEQMFSDKLAVSRFAISTSEFSFDKDKKLKVLKLLPPDFMIGRAKYDYRN